MKGRERTDFIFAIVFFVIGVAFGAIGMLTDASIGTGVAFIAMGSSAINSARIERLRNG